MHNNYKLELNFRATDKLIYKYPREEVVRHWTQGKVLFTVFFEQDQYPCNARISYWQLGFTIPLISYIFLSQ